MTFAVSHEIVGDRATICVHGDVDLDTARQVTAALAELDLSSVGRVLVDLSEVGFLDSSGLGALVGAHKACVAADTSFSVLCSDPRLLKLFEITRLRDVLNVVGTGQD